VPKIAKSFDENAIELAYKREFRTYLGELEERMLPNM